MWLRYLSVLLSGIKGYCNKYLSCELFWCHALIRHLFKIYHLIISDNQRSCHHTGAEKSISESGIHWMVCWWVSLQVLPPMKSRCLRLTSTWNKWTIEHALWQLLWGFRTGFLTPQLLLLAEFRRFFGQFCTIWVCICAWLCCFKQFLLVWVW